MGIIGRATIGFIGGFKYVFLKETDLTHNYYA